MHLRRLASYGRRMDGGKRTKLDICPSPVNLVFSACLVVVKLYYRSYCFNSGGARRLKLCIQMRLWGFPEVADCRMWLCRSEGVAGE